MVTSGMATVRTPARDLDRPTRNSPVSSTTCRCRTRTARARRQERRRGARHKLHAASPRRTVAWRAGHGAGATRGIVAGAPPCPPNATDLGAAPPPGQWRRALSDSLRAVIVRPTRITSCLTCRPTKHQHSDEPACPEHNSPRDEIRRRDPLRTFADEIYGQQRQEPAHHPAGPVQQGLTRLPVPRPLTIHHSFLRRYSSEPGGPGAAVEVTDVLVDSREPASGLFRVLEFPRLVRGVGKSHINRRNRRSPRRINGPMPGLKLAHGFFTGSRLRRSVPCARGPSAVPAWGLRAGLGRRRRGP